MPYSFSTALSGMRANANQLTVTGNNIANANTTAYKSQSLSFSDVFLGSGNSHVQIGNGVRTERTNTDFSQGGLSDSGSSTSAAIQGNGYFVVANNAGKQSYTRAGDFTLDRDGYVVTPGGQRVQGYTAENGVIPNDVSVNSIQVPLGAALPPAATTQVTLRMNLNSADAAGAVFHSPVQVYDSKGLSHTLDMIFTKQTDGSYLMSATLDGNAAQTDAGSGASSNPVAVNFDANGKLIAPPSLSIVPDQTQLGGGASLPSIAVNLRETNADGTPGATNITNFGSASAVASTKQDGFAAGSMTGVSLSTDGSGILFAVFNNGQIRPLGQLAVASFNAQSELNHEGGNLYSETVNSGQPSIGKAGSGGLGQIVGSALEQSNVDISTEFTNLIVAQRGFQANSRVITTINQTLQDLLQIV